MVQHSLYRYLHYGTFKTYDVRKLHKIDEKKGFDFKKNNSVTVDDLKLHFNALLHMLNP